MKARLRDCLLWMALAVGLPDAFAARVFEDSMAQRVMACTACHGEQGKAGPDGYYPRLAGKPAGYLYNQLLNFRTDRRHYPLMQGLIDSMDDAYLQSIASHFASQSVPYPAPLPARASAAELEQGRKLVQEGRSAAGLPACVQCHGPELMGVNPATPGLLGLPADYINAQLGGWQTGQRHATEPDCMAKIAKRLSAADISAVARWLSSQAPPAGARPADKAPATKLPLDLQCGSAPLPTAKANVVTENSATLVARGRYLARIGNCAVCHTARGGAAFAGGRAIETPFGAVLSSNITPDPVHGIGNWTADDFWQALHHGIAKDGRPLYPAFPYTSYTHIVRADSDALFAYFRTLSPVGAPNQPHALRWPYSTGLALRAWRALYFKAAPEGTTATTATTDGPSAIKARGAYLVNGPGHCMECHGARNAMGALSTSATRGGSVLPGGSWFAPALQDAGQASVAAWSQDEIVRFLTTGSNARAQATGPMAEVVLHGTQYLSAADATAMAVYLRALPQFTSDKAPPPLPGAQSARGAKLYETHCVDCHGLQGEGRAGAYPALSGNRTVLADNTNNLALSVMQGGFAPATAGNPQPYGMPPFMLRLSDADMSAVLTYIRSTWGNTAPAISEFDINKLRRSQVP